MKYLSGLGPTTKNQIGTSLLWDYIGGSVSTSGVLVQSPRKYISTSPKYLKRHQAHSQYIAIYHDGNALMLGLGLRDLGFRVGVSALWEGIT